jgi:hypothetical protein
VCRCQRLDGDQMSGMGAVQPPLCRLQLRTPSTTDGPSRYWINLVSAS